MSNVIAVVNHKGGTGKTSLVMNLAAVLSTSRRRVVVLDLDEAALADALTDGVPADPAERTPEQHARWLLAQLIGWHRREEKSFWWEYFARLEYSDEELLEDRATLGDLRYERVVDTVKQSLVHRYRFPPQDHDFRIDDKPHDPATGAFAGTVVAIPGGRGGSG